METTTLSNRTLRIDGMTGDVCVKKVTEALKGVPGVKTNSVKVGTATIGADQAGCNAACAAIGKAGFKVHEDGRADANGHARATATRSSSDSATVHAASNTPSKGGASPVSAGVATQKPAGAEKCADKSAMTDRTDRTAEAAPRHPGSAKPVARPSGDRPVEPLKLAD